MIVAQLSRALRTHLYAPDMWSLLEPFGCGWLDGGCRELAQALVAWLGSGAELWSIRDGSGRVQHVVARLDQLFLDGDGVSSADALLHRWQHQEGLSAPCLAPFDAGEAAGNGVFSDPDLGVATLAALRAWRNGRTFALALTSGGGIQD